MVPAIKSQACTTDTTVGRVRGRAARHAAAAAAVACHLLLLMTHKPPPPAPATNALPPIAAAHRPPTACAHAQGLPTMSAAVQRCALPSSTFAEGSFRALSARFNCEQAWTKRAALKTQ